MRRRERRYREIATAAVALLLTMAVAAGCATTQGAASDRAAKSDDAIASKPEPNVKTLYAMARMLRAQGKADEEEIVLRRILAQEPKFVPAYADLAEIRMRQHLYTEASQELQQGLAVAPADPVLLNDLGVCAIMEKNHEKALQQFTQASQAAPRDTRYKANMALALGLLGRYEESLNLYRQVMSGADADHNLAVIKQMRGETGGEAQAAAPVQEDLPPQKLVPEEVAAAPGPETADAPAQP